MAVVENFLVSSKHNSANKVFSSSVIKVAKVVVINVEILKVSNKDYLSVKRKEKEVFEKVKEENEI